MVAKTVKTTNGRREKLSKVVVCSKQLCSHSCFLAGVWSNSNSNSKRIWTCQHDSRGTFYSQSTNHLMQFVFELSTLLKYLNSPESVRRLESANKFHSCQQFDFEKVIQESGFRVAARSQYFNNSRFQILMFAVTFVNQFKE